MLLGLQKPNSSNEAGVRFVGGSEEASKVPKTDPICASKQEARPTVPKLHQPRSRCQWKDSQAVSRASSHLTTIRCRELKRHCIYQTGIICCFPSFNKKCLVELMICRCENVASRTVWWCTLYSLKTQTLNRVFHSHQQASRVTRACGAGKDPHVAFTVSINSRGSNQWSLY